MIPRDKPMVQPITNVTENVRRWYGPDDRVAFIDCDDYTAALDFEDKLIILQRGDAAELMNLLYARDEQKGLYEAFWNSYR